MSTHKNAIAVLLCKTLQKYLFQKYQPNICDIFKAILC